jgi:CheY-like chemotaxis protein
MKTVLYADDDTASREYCRRVLEDEGYRVLLATDGTEAIDVVEHQQPDVAVLDLRMPQKGGFEVAEEIGAHHDAIPIILYTGNEEMCLNDHRARYAAACIPKSTDLTELALAISRVLSQRKQGAPVRVGLPPARD